MKRLSTFAQSILLFCMSILLSGSAIYIGAMLTEQIPANLTNAVIAGIAGTISGLVLIYALIQEIKQAYPITPSKNHAN